MSNTALHHRPASLRRRISRLLRWIYEASMRNEYAEMRYEIQELRVHERELRERIEMLEMQIEILSS